MNPGSETISVCITRLSGQPWGFRLQGGADFTTPLSIQSIVPGSPSDLSGLKAGDAVLNINNQSSDELSHDAAKQVIIRSGNQVDMLIQRGAVQIWKPKVTPLSELKPGEMRQIPGAGGEVCVQKTSLAADKQEVQHIGSSHNRAPKPFPGFGGGAPAAAAAAPPVAPPAAPPTAPPTAVPAPTVVHSQYNSPMQIYTQDNVETTYNDTTSQLSQQIASLKVDEHNNNTKPASLQRSASPVGVIRSSSPAYLCPSTAASGTPAPRSVSPTLAFLQEQEQKQGTQMNQPMSEQYRDYHDGEEIGYKGYMDHSKQSRSFKMLNIELQGGDDGNGPPPPQPAAPTAAASSGFRSVKAPTALPPDQRPQQPQLSTCGVCGSLCVGVFVRIKGQPMHPECFKCTTCGLNLKQQGYFQVEGKLYCEAHARQVAQPPGPDMVIDKVVYR